MREGSCETRKRKGLRDEVGSEELLKNHPRSDLGRIAQNRRFGAAEADEYLLPRRWKDFRRISAAQSWETSRCRVPCDDILFVYLCTNSKLSKWLR
jgi:hypothetical protein